MVSFSTITTSIVEKESKTGPRLEKFGKNEKGGTTLIFRILLKISDLDPKAPKELREQPAVYDVVSFYDEVGGKSFRLDPSVSPVFKKALEGKKGIKKSVYSVFPVFQYNLNSKSAIDPENPGDLKVAEFTEAKMKKLRQLINSETIDDDSFNIADVDITTATEDKQLGTVKYLDMTFAVSKKNRLDMIDEKVVAQIKKQAKEFMEQTALKRGGEILTEKEIEDLVGNVLDIDDEPAPRSKSTVNDIEIAEEEQTKATSKKKVSDPWED